MSNWMITRNNVRSSDRHYGFSMRYLVALTLPFLITLALYFLLELMLWPAKQNEIDHIIQKGQQLEFTRSAAQQKVKQQEELMEVWEQERILYEVHFNQFDDVDHSTNMLGIISDLAQKIGIDIEQIEWREEVQFVGYSEFPFVLKVRGQYSSLTQLFLAFSTPPIIVISRADWQRINEESDDIYVDIQASYFKLERKIEAMK
ncbi:type 4a pilus biogenesis protein PilO [Vibrio sp. RC27]